MSRTRASAFRIRSVRDNLAKASGVASVTVADGLPLDFRGRIARVSLQADANVAPRFVSVQVTRVGDGYLNTMGIPLLRGRGFTVDDGAGAEMVTIISKTLADQLFPNARRRGHRQAVDLRSRRGKTQQTLTIVGVTARFSHVADEHGASTVAVAAGPAPVVRTVFLDRAQRGWRTTEKCDARPSRTRSANLRPGRSTARSRHGDGVRPMPGSSPACALRQNSMHDFLTQSAVAGVAGGVILTAGCAWHLRRRRIDGRDAHARDRRAGRAGRLASRVLGMILFDVVKLVAAWRRRRTRLTAALVRLNGENMGIPLSNVEPLAYVAGAAIAILVAVLASLAPARRAASVQPMVAMRST